VSADERTYGVLPLDSSARQFDVLIAMAGCPSEPHHGLNHNDDIDDRCNRRVNIHLFDTLVSGR